MQSEDVVRVAAAHNPAEAHLWRQALEDEGIPAKVVGEFLDAGFIDAPGIQPEVWVHRSDLERAAAFLQAHHGVTEEADQEEG